MELFNIYDNTLQRFCQMNKNGIIGFCASTGAIAGAIKAFFRFKKICRKYIEYDTGDCIVYSICKTFEYFGLGSALGFALVCFPKLTICFIYLLCLQYIFIRI